MLESRSLEGVLLDVASTVAEDRLSLFRLSHGFIYTLCCRTRESLGVFVRVCSCARVGECVNSAHSLHMSLRVVRLRGALGHPIWRGRPFLGRTLKQAGLRVYALQHSHLDRKARESLDFLCCCIAAFPLLHEIEVDVQCL